MLSLLSHHIATHGSIPTARVSSAQARGRAKNYTYWGAVRYQIRLLADGRPSNVSMERASSDRRSERLCDLDCDTLCECEGRIRWQRIGRLKESDARRILERLGCYGDALRRHDERAQRRGHAPTLQQRLLAHLAVRYGGMTRDAAIQAVLDGRVNRDGRWLSVRANERSYGVSHYMPCGDERDAAAFAAETNQERRRKIIDACGERVVTDGARTLMQQDDFGRLYRDWDGRRIVRVVCPSTGAIYWLPVSHRCRTAKEAVAETFGLSVDEYSPAAEG